MANEILPGGKLFRMMDDMNAVSAAGNFAESDAVRRNEKSVGAERRQNPVETGRPVAGKAPAPKFAPQIARDGEVTGGNKRAPNVEVRHVRQSGVFLKQGPTVPVNTFFEPAKRGEVQKLGGIKKRIAEQTRRNGAVFAETAEFGGDRRGGAKRLFGSAAEKPLLRDRQIECQKKDRRQKKKILSLINFYVVYQAIIMLMMYQY